MNITESAVVVSLSTLLATATIPLYNEITDKGKASVLNSFGTYMKVTSDLLYQGDAQTTCFDIVKNPLKGDNVNFNDNGLKLDPTYKDDTAECHFTVQGIPNYELKVTLTTATSSATSSIISL